MPTSQSTANPISRLLRIPPHRELFRTLSDSLDEPLLVLSGDASAIEGANHAFLLLSGYARNELEQLDPRDLLVGEQGQAVLTQLHDSEELTEITFEQISLRTREGAEEEMDLQVLPVGAPRSALLLKASPSHLRLDEQSVHHARGEQLDRLAEISRVLLEGASAGLARALELAPELISASAVGIYRLSANLPEYLLQGSLPEEFPLKLPATDFEPLSEPILWSKGEPAEHPLLRAARSLGLKALRTKPLGTDSAWIGLLVAAWKDSADVPADVEHLIDMLATMLHAGILLDIQRTSIASLEQDTQSLDLEFQGHMSAVGDSVLSLDSSLSISRANQAAGEMLGYQADELIGLPIQEVLVGPPDIMTTLLDVLGHQRPAERTRLTIHRRDGTPIPIHLRAVPMDRSAHSRLLLVLRDQSEQKAIEDQTEILAQRALLGEVAAIFAHEVRNPINNISTGLQLIASRLGQDHPQHPALEKIRHECTRLDQLMEDVLFFARPLELKITALDLPELMDRILSRWEPRLRQEGLKSHRSYDPDTPSVLADSRTLEQVITNLITNAVQAMSEGGTLSVTIGPTVSKSGPMVELKIADTGPGIREDLKDRIFDPFFTTKKSGTGLGLAISRRIMIAHQGGISVESYPDAGTVFSLQLPAEASRSEVTSV